MSAGGHTEGDVGNYTLGLWETRPKRHYLLFRCHPLTIRLVPTSMCDLVILFRLIKWPQKGVWGEGRMVEGSSCLAHPRLENTCSAFPRAPWIWGVGPSVRGGRGWPTLVRVARFPASLTQAHPRALSSRSQPLVLLHQPRHSRKSKDPQSRGWDISGSVSSEPSLCRQQGQRSSECLSSVASCDSSNFPRRESVGRSHSTDEDMVLFLLGLAPWTLSKPVPLGPSPLRPTVCPPTIP